MFMKWGVMPAHELKLLTGDDRHYAKILYDNLKRAEDLEEGATPHNPVLKKVLQDSLTLYPCNHIEFIAAYESAFGREE